MVSTKTLHPTKETVQKSVAVASNPASNHRSFLLLVKLAGDERFDAFDRTRTHVHQRKLAFRDCKTVGGRASGSEHGPPATQSISREEGKRRKR
jgi:hypothetical protein